MTILITGATGLIGRPLTRALVDQGQQVRVVTRRPHRVLEAFSAYSSRVLAFEWHPRTEPFPPEALQGVERIVHLMGEPIYGPATREARQREDGAWEIEGAMPVAELKSRLEIDAFPDEDKGRYATVAGLMHAMAGTLLQRGEHVDGAGWRFEVLELDGRRIDRVLVTRPPAPPAADSGFDRDDG